MKRSLSVALAGVLALGVLAGCGSKPGKVYEAPKTTEQPQAATAPKAEGKLKIGQLPVVDGLPFWVAEQKGYYKQEGVEVELITFNSANERDAAIISGDIDGMLADPIATTSLVASGSAKVKINSLGLGATKEEGPMAIIAAPGSGITKVEDLKGVEIAISNGSVMDYAVEKLLKDAGLKGEEIKTTNIPQINIRYESLMSGKIKAAILPEPWLSMAAANKDAKVIVHDATAGKLNYSLSVIDFREQSMKEKPNAIKRFFIAYNRAVADLRIDPQGYMDLLMTRGKAPAEVKTVYKNVPPSMAQAPKKEDLESVVQWLVDRKIIKAKVEYEQLVDTSLIPTK